MATAASAAKTPVRRAPAKPRNKPVVTVKDLTFEDVKVFEHVLLYQDKIVTGSNVSSVLYRYIERSELNASRWAVKRNPAFNKT